MLAGPAGAQQIELKPLADARLRWEHVDQDPLPRDADAVTARVRSGLQASLDGWSALVESEAVLGILPHYNDGLNGKTRYPVVGDPQNIELNRAQIRRTWRSGSITAGRQLLELADQRFVGSANFRQSQQSFDAVRLVAAPAGGLSIDLSYAWSNRTINGIDGRGARQQAVSGDNIFALVGYKTPIGTLTGFAYLVDQDEAAVQGYRLSSQSYGVRLAGNRPLGPGWKLAYAASVATQSDYHRNPNRYRARYRAAEASLTHAVVTGTAGFEILGADRGAALTSFQTPLSSLFKFQGWADKFLTTPPDGVRDYYAGLTGAWPKVGTLSGLSATIAYHRFTSDRLVRRYGDEWDALAGAKTGGIAYSLRYARYSADKFATATDKLWLTAEWAL